MKKITIIFYYLEFVSTLNHLQSQTPSNIQKAAVENLFARILTHNANLFKVVIDRSFTFQGKDRFKVCI
jgi:hypothetical protein